MPPDERPPAAEPAEHTIELDALAITQRRLTNALNRLADVENELARTQVACDVLGARLADLEPAGTRHGS